MTANRRKKRGLGLLTQAKSRLGGAHHPAAGTEAASPGTEGWRDGAAWGQMQPRQHAQSYSQTLQDELRTSASESVRPSSQAALVSGGRWGSTLDQCAETNGVKPCA